MRGTQPRLRRFVGAAALSCTSVLVGLSFASIPAGAQTAPVMTAPTTATASCPVLSVANPSPGDNVGSGGYVISGEAFDPAATTGSGVSNVDLFLGPRDQGGLFLGSAIPGTGSNPRAFTLEVTVPSNVNSETDFAAYAQSSVTGASTSVSFPVFVGQQPRPGIGLVTPTPVPAGEVVVNNCPQLGTTSTAATTGLAVSGTPAAVPSVSVMATPGTTGVAVTAPATGAANACPTLSLANPGPGDLLPPGGLFISGTASVAGSTSGSGVQRVDLFLGERDEGGTFLGSGIPGTGGSADAFTIEVTVPNLMRGVDFAAYAIGVNGQEQAVTFPVFVGAEPTRTAVGPTPTPIPQTITVTSTCK